MAVSNAPAVSASIWVAFGGAMCRRTRRPCRDSAGSPLRTTSGAGCSPRRSPSAGDERGRRDRLPPQVGGARHVVGPTGPPSRPGAVVGGPGRLGVDPSWAVPADRAGDSAGREAAADGVERSLRPLVATAASPHRLGDASGERASTAPSPERSCRGARVAADGAPRVRALDPAGRRRRLRGNARRPVALLGEDPRSAARRIRATRSRCSRAASTPRLAGRRARRRRRTELPARSTASTRKLYDVPYRNRGSDAGSTRTTCARRRWARRAASTTASVGAVRAVHDGQPGPGRGQAPAVPAGDDLVQVVPVRPRRRAPGSAPRAAGTRRRARRPARWTAAGLRRHRDPALGAGCATRVTSSHTSTRMPRTRSSSSSSRVPSSAASFSASWHAGAQLGGPLAAGEREAGRAQRARGGRRRVAVGLARVLAGEVARVLVELEARRRRGRRRARPTRRHRAAARRPPTRRWTSPRTPRRRRPRPSCAAARTCRSGSGDVSVTLTQVAPASAARAPAASSPSSTTSIARPSRRSSAGVDAERADLGVEVVLGPVGPRRRRRVGSGSLRGACCGCSGRS